MESFSVDIPKVFGIPITDKCHLRCPSCFNTDERFKQAEHMDLAEFKKIVDWILSEGVEYIDITPTVGEALLIPNLSEYLDYLDQSDVKRYTLITSLAHKNIQPLMDRPKLLVEVSLYGCSREQYMENTKKDVFELVCNNMIKLSKQRFNVLKRFDGGMVNSKLNVILALENVKLRDYSTDRGLQIKYNGEIRKCQFMNEPLLTPNGISLCCIDYDYTKYNIGSIGDNLKDVYSDIQSTIAEKDLKCSTACDWFKPWEDDRGLDR